MCKTLKQLARARGASRGSPSGGLRGAGRHHCADAEPPLDRSGLQEVVEQATRTSAQMALHLAPRFDSDHVPISLAERRDSLPCGAADCAYAFVLAVPLRSRESAERSARRQLPPRATRSFVELQLANACVMSCEHLAQIDEERVRDAEPTATATLRLLRDAGADVLFIRGRFSRRVAVVFTQAIGRQVQVVAEGAATVGYDGTWVSDTPEPPQSPDGWRALVHRPQWPGAGRIAWELTIALVCFLLAPPLAKLAGATLTVPVWAEVLLGAAAAGAAAVATWRALVPARAELARVPDHRFDHRDSRAD
jgi:hypothetical protein